MWGSWTKGRCRWMVKEEERKKEEVVRKSAMLARAGR